MEEGSRRVASAAAVLPDELVVEILAQLPSKSLCRCRCVSPAWRVLISDPANRRRFAQTLSGLFFSRPEGSSPPWGFVGLSMSPPPGGRLLYVYDRWLDDALSIYVLEDHDSEEGVWICKQNINKVNLFGPRSQLGCYDIAAFHPDSDLVLFYDWAQKRLMSYDMKHRDVKVICTVGEELKLLHGEYLEERRLFFSLCSIVRGGISIT